MASLDRGSDLESGGPAWAEGLQKNGEYYEGYVGNLDDTLAKHSSETVTTYGIRKSRMSKHQQDISSNKENVQVQDISSNKENIQV